MKIYDISPEISELSAVFPGDESFKRNVSLDIKSGDHLTLSSIQSTLHIGAHADAPCHYNGQGEEISVRSLNYYLGPCQVIAAKEKAGARLTPQALEGKVIKAPRVLFSTGSFPHPNKWNNDFNSLSPELIHQLAEQSVITVGIDTPSVDPWDSKELESHKLIFEKDMAILEGLDLKGVPEGVYELIALPLKLKGADASPVRAILKCT